MPLNNLKSVRGLMAHGKGLENLEKGLPQACLWVWPCTPGFAFSWYLRSRAVESQRKKETMEKGYKHIKGLLSLL